MQEKLKRRTASNGSILCSIKFAYIHNMNWVIEPKQIEIIFYKFWSVLCMSNISYRVN